MVEGNREPQRLKAEGVKAEGIGNCKAIH